MLQDRRPRDIITHRIACGRPGVGGGAPSALDYFEITSSSRPSDTGLFPVDGAAMERLKELGYGEKPTRIPIRVDSDNIEDFVLQNYTSRVSMPVRDRLGEVVRVKKGADLVELTRLRVWCQGDGRKARRMQRDGSEQEIPCCSNPFDHRARSREELTKILRKEMKHDPFDGARCPYAQNEDSKAGPICKPETIMLVRCDVVSNVGARCRYVSHGHRTADRIVHSLQDIKAKMPNGILRDVPLDLVLRMEKISRPDGRPGRLQPVVHVELRVPVEQAVALLHANLQQRLQVEQLAPRAAPAALLRAAEEQVTDDLDGDVLEGADAGGSVR